MMQGILKGDCVTWTWKFINAILGSADTFFLVFFEGKRVAVHFLDEISLSKLFINKGSA